MDTEVGPDGIVSLAGSLWVATDSGPLLQRIDPAPGEVTGTFRVSDQGPINANQLIGIGDGALWFPLLDAGDRREGRDPDRGVALAGQTVASGLTPASPSPSPSAASPSPSAPSVTPSSV